VQDKGVVLSAYVITLAVERKKERRKRADGKNYKNQEKKEETDSSSIPVDRCKITLRFATEGGWTRSEYGDSMPTLKRWILPRFYN
jgi:hypothetical protein